MQSVLSTRGYVNMRKPLDNAKDTVAAGLFIILISP